MNEPPNTPPARKASAKRRRLSPDERRESLLDAGQKLFGAKPYDEVSLAEISRLAGVSRPLIQHYFGNKRELYRAIFARALETLSEGVHIEPAEGGPLPLDFETALERMRGYFGYALAHPAGALVAGQSGGDAVVDQLIRDFIDRTTDLVMEQVPEPSPFLPAALQAWSHMNIGLTLRLVRGGDVDAEWAATFSTKMLFAAIAAA